MARQTQPSTITIRLPTITVQMARVIRAGQVGIGGAVVRQVRIPAVGTPVVQIRQVRIPAVGIVGTPVVRIPAVGTIPAALMMADMFHYQATRWRFHFPSQYPYRRSI